MAKIPRLRLHAGIRRCRTALPLAPAPQADAAPLAPPAKSWVSVVKNFNTEKDEPGEAAFPLAPAQPADAAPLARQAKSSAGVVKNLNTEKCEPGEAAAPPAQAPPAASTSPAPLAAKSWINVVKGLNTESCESGKAPPPARAPPARAPPAATTPPALPAAKSWASVVKGLNTEKCELGKAPETPAKTAKPAGVSRVDRPRVADAAITSTSSGVGTSAGTSKGKGKGFGKGLPYFNRIEVGIEDDSNFCAVRRLLGHGGKHVKNILVCCPRVKVWLCGRGSRSWDDTEGPLTFCIGSPVASSFAKAIDLVNELLHKTREEHAEFLRRVGS